MRSTQHVMAMGAQQFPIVILEKDDGSFEVSGRGETGAGKSIVEAARELRKKLRASAGGKSNIVNRMGGF